MLCSDAKSVRFPRETRSRDARRRDRDASNAMPPDPLAHKELREDREGEWRHGDDPPGVDRRGRDEPRDLHQEVQREDRAAEKKRPGIGARKPQRHVLHKEYAAHDWKSDRQTELENQSVVFDF